LDDAFIKLNDSNKESQISLVNRSETITESWVFEKKKVLKLASLLSGIWLANEP